MKTSRVALLAGALCIGTILTGCSSPEEGAEQGETIDQGGKLGVIVGNYPLMYFVERTGSPLVEVRFPAKVADDPAYWKPTAEEVAAMQESELIVLNGASYEKWLKNVSLSQSRTVNTSVGFEDRLIPLEETVTHSHGLEGAHEHSGTAFTTWMDLSLAIEQARAVKDALAVRLPEHKGQFEEQFKDLEKDIQAIDAKMKEVVAKSPETPVFFSHPVYQYFEHAYGVNGKSVHWEPDEMPDEASWKEFEELLKEHPAKWMVWEGEPDPEIATKLEELGVEIAVVDPCGNVPATGDFLTVMHKNLEELQQVYAKEE